jgi:hypothetical protein
MWMGLTGRCGRPWFGTKLTESGRGCVTPTRKTPSFLSTPEICSSFAFLILKEGSPVGSPFSFGTYPLGSVAPEPTNTKCTCVDGSVLGGTIEFALKLTYQ